MEDPKTLLFLILTLCVVVLFVVALFLIMTGIIFFKYHDKIVKFFHDIFVPKVEMVRGRFLRLKTRIRYVAYYSMQPSSSLLVATRSPMMIVPITEYFVVIENDLTHKKSSVEISQESFNDLEGKKISSKLRKSICVYLKKYFVWGTEFDHVELIES